MNAPLLPNQLLQLSDEVRDALESHRPVVALETAIVSHGMPFPQNIELAREAERIVRENGSVPATIAVLDGQVCAGISLEQLERIATARDVLKCSRGDIAYVLASRRTGSTTVAGTIFAAHHAGIEVMATGGIGGVHRGAENTFDISADLTELARTPVAVVCAGVKALLDIPKTLEVLETYGVPVITFGSDTFPAFWSAKSNLHTPLRADSLEELSRFLEMQRALEMTSGAVIAQPIAQADEIPYEQMSGFIARATTEAQEKRISGKAVTPWVLNRLAELTGGRSLTANISLVKRNAALAAQLAVAATRLAVAY